MYLSTDHFDIIQKYVHLVLRNLRLLNLIIHLETKTPTSMERVNEKGRSEESDLTYDYLHRLNPLHGNIFSRLTGLF